MYQHILVAVDGSDNSMRALQEAIRLKSKVTLLSVVSAEDAKDAVLHYQEDSIMHRKHQLAHMISLLEDTNIQYELLVVHGEVCETIIKTSQSGNYDLLVIGSRGLNRFQEAVIGSVSKRIIREVKIPVLVVK